MKYVLLCFNMLLLSYLTGVPVKYFSPKNIDTSRAVVLKLGGAGGLSPLGTFSHVCRLFWLRTPIQKAGTQLVFLPCHLAQHFKNYTYVKPLIFFCFLLTKYTRIKINVSDLLQQLYKALPSVDSIHVQISFFRFTFYRKGVFRKLCGLASLENKSSTSFIYA